MRMDVGGRDRDGIQGRVRIPACGDSACTYGIQHERSCANRVQISFYEAWSLGGGCGWIYLWSVWSVEVKFIMNCASGGWMLRVRELSLSCTMSWIDVGITVMLDKCFRPRRGPRSRAFLVDMY